MKPSKALNMHRAMIRQIVELHRAKNVRVFGSVLHGNDTENSDLDLLIDLTSETTLMDIGAIRRELKALLGVELDIVTPNSIPSFLRDKIINEASPV